MLLGEESFLYLPIQEGLRTSTDSAGLSSFCGSAMEADQTAEPPLTTSQFDRNFLKSNEHYMTDPTVFFSNNLWLADQTATNGTTSVSNYFRPDE